MSEQEVIDKAVPLHEFLCFSLRLSESCYHNMYILTSAFTTGRSKHAPDLAFCPVANWVRICL